MRFVALVLLGLIAAAGDVLAQDAGQNWLGGQLEDLSTKEAKAQGWKTPRGAKVGQLVPGGPAETAGLRTGDIIVLFDDVEIEDAEKLKTHISIRPAGSKVTLSILRNGRKQELTVKLGSDERLPAEAGTSAVAPAVITPLPGEMVTPDKAKIEVVPDIPHGSTIDATAFTPDGARVVSAGWDKNIKLWDIATGKLLRTYEETSGVRAVAVSPDGSRIVSGRWDDALVVRDTATGKVLRKIKLPNDSTDVVTFSPDSTRILSGGKNGTITIWDAVTGENRGVIQAHLDNINSVAVSPDGTRVLTSSDDSNVRLWDIASGKLIHTFKGHSDAVNSVAFSPDGSRVISGGGDGIAIVWNVADGSLLQTFHQFRDVKETPEAANDIHQIDYVAFAPDGVHAISAGSGGYQYWNTADGRVVYMKTDPKGVVSRVSLSPDGTRVLAIGSSYRPVLVDLASGNVHRVFNGHAAGVSALVFSPDSSRLATGGLKGALKVWNVANGQLQNSFKGLEKTVATVAFSPDGTRLVTGGYDHALTVWDAASGQSLRTLKGHTKTIYGVAFSPAGDRIASAGDDGTLRLWDAATGQSLRTLKAPGRDDFLKGVAFSPDGSRLLTGGEDDILRLWDAKTGKLLHSMKGHESFIYSVAYSPDGATVLSASWDGTLKLWSASTGKLIRTYGQSTMAKTSDEEEYLSSVAFSPDGTRIASGAWAKTVKLWDTESGKLLHTMYGHSDQVTSVAFSRDGKWLASGGEDGLVVLWDIRTGRPVVNLVSAPNDEWLTMTPAGFFANSPKGHEMLSVVRGVEPFSVMQFYDHLHRPDLVDEALKGDPEGKHKDAAARLSLESILGSGPAPRIELLPNRTEKSGSTVKLAIRIIDASGGIGSKVIWRVNGTTQGETTGPGLGTAPYPGHYALMTQTLTVDPAKKNEVEIVAYNHKGLLATTPYRFSIDPFGVTQEERPRLFALAVGVNDYIKPDWRLRYAANDATALGAALKAVGSPLFGDVQVTALLDKDATERGIGAAFERLAAVIKPRDVFVLYLGGHGRSISGSGWFFVPQDLNPEAHHTIEGNGIGQDKWQRWLAKIAAAKSVVILDACEAGASEAFRGGDRERETVMSQLEYATGRNIIAATPSGKAAYEGYRGHGLLTYAVLEALHKPEGNGDETVDVYGLAAHVSRQVTEISLREFGVRQKPEPILHDNFPLGVRRPVLNVAETAGGAATGSPSAPTHILMRTVQVRQKPADDAPAGKELRKNTLVAVKQRDGAWALIERNGETLGYVPASVLEEVQ